MAARGSYMLSGEVLYVFAKNLVDLLQDSKIKVVEAELSESSAEAMFVYPVERGWCAKILLQSEDE